MNDFVDAGFTDAYRKIKDSILGLRYKPGQKLSETKLAADLRVGRSPVRSALARLERDGWVRVLPQQGTFVRKFSAADVAAMSELRLLLEAHAASVAATRATPGDLALLRSRFEALKAKGAEHHFDEFQELDDLFHGLVYRLAGNPFITEILRNLRDQIHWVRVINAMLPGRVDASLREMDRVLEAMEKRDGEAAAQAMRQHIGNIAISYEAVPADDNPRRHDAA
jgi:DNA-binding GntR family transcriptional regulator